MLSVDQYKLNRSCRRKREGKRDRELIWRNNGWKSPPNEEGIGISIQEAQGIPTKLMKETHIETCNINLSKAKNLESSKRKVTFHVWGSFHTIIRFLSKNLLEQKGTRWYFQSCERWKTKQNTHTHPKTNKNHDQTRILYPDKCPSKMEKWKLSKIDKSCRCSLLLELLWKKCKRQSFKVKGKDVSDTKPMKI